MSVGRSWRCLPGCSERESTRPQKNGRSPRPRVRPYCDCLANLPNGRARHHRPAEPARSPSIEAHLIAEQPRGRQARVSDEAHFKEGLRADWLDRLELMIAIEDQIMELKSGTRLRG